MWQFPVKCFSTGIVDSFTTVRIQAFPTFARNHQVDIAVKLQQGRSVPDRCAR